MHPLGAPDDTIGLRPGDLLDHLREASVKHYYVVVVFLH
jgi:hypothetical protein